jgi:hypothetical protein
MGFWNSKGSVIRSTSLFRSVSDWSALGNDAGCTLLSPVSAVEGRHPMDEDHKHPDNAHQQSSMRWLESKETDKDVSTAIGIVLGAAVLFFLMLAVAGPQRQEQTQVGQNIERSNTPDTPRNPDNVIRK